MSRAPFPIDPVLTGIALDYPLTMERPPIADIIFPRMNPPLAKEEFKYHKFRLAEGMTIPDTRVGRKSMPNEVEFGFDEVTDSTLDYALDDVVPDADFANAPPGYDPRDTAARKLTDLILLDREVRAAALAFAAATYPSGNKVTLSGTTQWSHASSTPIAAINDALLVPVIRPNTLVVSEATWAKLSTHAEIVSAVLGNDGTKGIATPEQVARLFRLNQVVIGTAVRNTAVKGQTLTRGSIWGKHAALIYRNPIAAGTKDQVTFGFTAQFGTRVAGSIPETKVGMRGAVRVRVGESVKEVVACNDVAYFFENAVA